MDKPIVRVVFTPNMQRHIACPPAGVEAVTVCETLDAAFAGNENLILASPRPPILSAPLPVMGRIS